MPAMLSFLISRFPFLERQPHPMTVHFPIVFFLSVVLFNILYLSYGVAFIQEYLSALSDNRLLSLPVAMLTGLLPGG